MVDYYISMGPYVKLPKLVVHSLSPSIHNTTDRLHRHTKPHSKVFELKIVWIDTMWGKDHPYQKAALNLHFLFHIAQTRMKWEMKEVTKIWYRWWQYKVQKALLFSFEAAVPFLLQNLKLSFFLTTLTLIFHFQEVCSLFVVRFLVQSSGLWFQLWVPENRVERTL